MRITTALALLSVFLSPNLARAQEPAREIRRSPDGRYFAGWFDHDAGAPFGVIRAVVVRSASDRYDIFSFVSSPRSTNAAWNSASTRCVLADAPDNGGPRTWLIYQKTPGTWASKELDPFATLYQAFRKSDPEVSHLFRPSILKIEWTSESVVRFRGYCNIGTYLITMDTSTPDKLPETQKLSDTWVEE